MISPHSFSALIEENKEIYVWIGITRDRDGDEIAEYLVISRSTPDGYSIGTFRGFADEGIRHVFDLEPVDPDEVFSDEIVVESSDHVLRHLLENIADGDVALLTKEGLNARFMKSATDRRSGDR